jgi:hypothetical protein
MRNTMKHTLGTAAIATGKSKTTIHRAIKSGKLSAVRREDGTFEIDPAELHRVFEPVTGNTDLEQSVTANETALLELENEFLKQQLAREREFNRELSALLASESEERKKLTALLTHQPKQKTDGGELWRKVFKQNTRS